MTILERLEQNKLIDKNGCWRWTGWHTPQGRGMVFWQGKKHQVHRLSAKYFKKDFTESLNVNHKCNVKDCWNPEHIYMGTQSENIRDYIATGNYKNQNTQKTHCIRGHAFEGNNLIIVDGKRRCRLCSNFRKRKWRRYKKI